MNVRKPIALLLAILMLFAIPLVGAQAESVFTAFTDTSDIIPLYNLCAPAKAAQEFVPDFDTIHTLKVYLDMDAGNTITLAIGKGTNYSDSIHSEDFAFTEAKKAGWVTFTLATPVNVTAGERYFFSMTSTQRTFWYGDDVCVSNTENCCTINFDESTGISGAIRQPHSTAFEVLPEPKDWQVVQETIAALPDTITLDDIAAVEAARYDYDLLSDESKASITNLDRLTAAETAVAELYTKVYTSQTAKTSIGLYNCKNVGGGQEFVPDFANLTKVTSWLSINAECDITLKIYQNFPGEDAVELYSETYHKAAADAGWVEFPLSTPLFLEEELGKYQFMLISTDTVIMYGDNQAVQTAAGCGAINGDQGGVRQGSCATAFKVEGTATEDYQKLIRSIKKLPTEIALENEAAVTALAAQYAALSAEDQPKVTNYSTLAAAQAAIDAIKLQQKIDALIADIGSLNVEALTLDDQAAVAGLRERYDALPADVQGKITNLSTLTTAEEKISELVAAERGYQALIDKINALPNQVTIANQALIEELAALYDALSPQDQAKVTNYDKLSDAQEYIWDITENAMHPDDSPFTYYLGHKYMLYLLTDPNNKGGQEFIPDFSELTTVAAYLKVDASTTITLTVGQNSTDSENAVALYTEDFEVEAGEGWYEFKLSTPLAVTPDEKHDFVLTSVEKAVLFGDLNVATDNMGCCSVSYDAEVHGGYVRRLNTAAFQVVGKEIDAYQLLINRINALPSEITLNHEKTVANLRSQYEDLSAEDRAKVINYDVLTAAEARLAEIKDNEQQADVENIINLIDAIGDTVTLDSYDAIAAADEALTTLIQNYGSEMVDSITNYDALVKARAAYNELVNSFVMGDINADSNINASDALLALQHSVKLTTLTDTAAIAANVNSDDNINAADALLILQYSVNLIDKFEIQFEEINLQTEKNQSLFEKTYQSMIDRTTEAGYASTSINGVYPGMFVRDTSCQILAHITCDDFDQARKILDYTFSYHELFSYDYALHVMDNNAVPISTKIQADATFYILHAWYQFAANAPQTDENKEFIERYIDKVKTFANYFLNTGYFNEELGLIRNPSLEHSRDAAYFNAYDLLTNTFASQVLHELSIYFADSDPENATKWGEYADKLVEGVHKNLVAEVDGKKIYAEMISIDKLITGSGYTGQPVEDDTFYIGFSWVNMFPAGIDWYAMDDEIMDNTYEMYLKYGSQTYFKKYQMLDSCGTYRSPEDYKVTSNHVIGKGLAWEIIYCYNTGRYERVRELITFVEENSDKMYRETWAISGGGGDTANQEHASWMLNAMEQVCNFS